MNLPGSAKTHLWAGLILAFVGILVGGYAYTGERIYRIAFLPIALVGLVMVLGGSALAGYGQANRPRLGGRQDDDDDPSLLDRLRSWITDLRGDDEDQDGEPEAADSDTGTGDAQAASP